MFAEFRRHRTRLIDGIGHWTAIEAAAQVTNAIRDFLAALTTNPIRAFSSRSRKDESPNASGHSDAFHQRSRSGRHRCGAV